MKMKKYLAIRCREIFSWMRLLTKLAKMYAGKISDSSSSTQNLKISTKIKSNKSVNSNLQFLKWQHKKFVKMGKKLNRRDRLGMFFVSGNIKLHECPRLKVITTWKAIKSHKSVESVANSAGIQQQRNGR